MSALAPHLVTVVTFLPLLFAVLVWLLPQGERGQIRVVTFIGMLVTLAAAIWLYASFDPKGPEIQLEYRAHWIPALGIGYHVGVDGLAVSLMLLTGLLGPLTVLASASAVKERVKEFHLALLVLQTAMLGTLASLDLILFYVFWEAMLVPMYLLIGVWGSEDRITATLKFFLYTLVGSFLMLVAILAVYFIHSPGAGRTFDFPQLYNALLSAHRELAACRTSPAACHLSPVAQSLQTFGPWMFLAFAAAFAVKVPMFPLHTWLPDAHVQAPTAGSIILAGVMLKMGTFGFWRYAIPLFPEAAREFRVLFAVLAVIGIVYGALMSLAQKDVKKLIAYSSVSHLGFCMLGMFALTPEGASGSAYQMLNHGVSTGALFLLFGLLYERRHSRWISDYGGIAKVMPAFAAVFLIITFSSIAVPGTNGFVGEFLVLLGTFKSSLGIAFGVVAALAVILGAGYMLWMVQRVFFGPLAQAENQHLPDLGVREWAAALPLVILVFVMGLIPQPFLDRLAPSSDRFVARASLGGPGPQPMDELVRMAALAEEPSPSALPPPPAPVVVPPPPARLPTLPVPPPGSPQRPTQLPILPRPYLKRGP